MKVVKSTHRHKLNKDYAIIVDFNRSHKDLVAFNHYKRELARVMGPKITYTDTLNEQGEDWVRNPRWFWEENTRYHRRRLYFKTQKEWLWATLSV